MSLSSRDKNTFFLSASSLLRAQCAQDIQSKSANAHTVLVFCGLNAALCFNGAVGLCMAAALRMLAELSVYNKMQQVSRETWLCAPIPFNFAPQPSNFVSQPPLTLCPNPYHSACWRKRLRLQLTRFFYTSRTIPSSNAISRNRRGTNVYSV